jgi:hypothetical protein
MSKPDWKKSSTTHGGNLGNIPKPHVRKFPHKGLLRQVEVTISSFVGVCQGARHYIPRIEEEHNPIWNSDEGSWQNAWDDLEGKGTVIEGPRLLSEKDAREWVQWMLRAFDPKRYSFHYAFHTSSPKWFYAREGD